MPPSAMQGTPAARQAWAASYTAVSCGTPTPATIRVVQIEPGPIPTLTRPRQPQSWLSTGAGADVAADDLHAVEGGVVLQAGNHVECQTGLTVGGVDHEHVHASSIRAEARCQASPRKPTPAATRRRPCSSLVASGYCSVLTKSLTVISRSGGLPRQRAAASQPCAGRADGERRPWKCWTGQ